MAIHQSNLSGFKRLFFACACITLLSSRLFAGGNADKVDSLLKSAGKISVKNPQAAIAIAKKAYEISLENKLPVKQIKCLNTLTYYYWNIHDLSNAEICAHKGFEIASTNHVDSTAGDFCVLNGAIKHTQNNYQQAITWYKTALPYYSKARLIKRAGNTYVNIGICEMRLSDYDEAIIDMQRSAEIFQTARDTADLAASYNSIGACFNLSENYQKAIKYYRAALELRRELKDEALIAQSLNNLGFAYFKKRVLDSAIVLFTECLKMRKAQTDSSNLVIPLQNLASAWKAKLDLSKATTLNIRSVKIADHYGMQEDLAKGYLALADIYTLQKKYDQARNNINAAERSAQSLHIPDLTIDIYTSKSNFLSQTGEYRDALLYHIKRDRIRDSIFTLKKNEALEELETRYRTRQNEKNIADLRLQNNLKNKILKQQQHFIIMLSLTGALLLLLFAITYRNYRLKTRANLRVQSLMQELHHRVKNNLQILSGIFTLQLQTSKDEDVKNTLRENESRLASMNLIHNKLYLNDRDTTIEMHEYLSKLLNHIKNSFSTPIDDIHLDIDIENLYLEADKAVAIGLIINELATNTFKYAFSGPGGAIRLGLKKENKVLSVYFSDNGRGMTEIAHNKNSFGLKLVDLLIRQLGATLDINRTAGLMYIIILPL